MKREQSNNNVQHKINEESSLKSPPGGLSEYTTKTLLLAFEASGETRDTFDLLGFCGANDDIYGSKGSVLRKQVQQRWSKIKRRDLDSYILLLEKFSIHPGPTTKLLVAAKMNSENDEESSNASEGSASLNTSITSHTTRTSEAEDETLTANKKKSCRGHHGDQKKKTIPASDLFSSPSRTSTRTSSRNKGRGSKAPPAAPKTVAVAQPPVPFSVFPPPNVQRQHVFGETSPLIGQFENTRDPSTSVPTSWMVNQNGLLENPWILEVNIQRAEANRDFDIEHVQGIDQDDIYVRNGFHIRRMVAADDHDDWTATIPTNYEPQYAKRIIMVKGPSRDYWLRITKMVT